MSRSFRRFQRSNVLAALCLGLLSFGVIAGLRWPGCLQELELTAFDWLMRVKAQEASPSRRIAVIGVSEEDIENLGRWPVADAQLAEILERVLRHVPRAVGVDLFRNLPVPPGTDRLEAVLRGNPEIIMVSKFGPSGVPPPACLAGTGQVGFSDVLVDRGGIVRRGLLYLDSGGRVGTSLGLQLALRYLEEEGIFPEPSPENPDHLKLGPTVVRPLEENDGGYVQADARGYQFLLHFKSARRPYPVLSISRLLAGDFETERLEEAVVLIGVMAQSIKDLFYTSFSPGLEGRQHLPGILLHASIADQLIQFGLGEAEPLRSLAEGEEYLLILAWGLCGALAVLLFRSVGILLLLGIAGLGLIGLSALLSLDHGLWIPMVPPVLAFTASQLGVIAFFSSKEARQRALLMDLFSRHVSPEVAETIWRERHQILKDGRPQSRKLTVTVLFSDLQGYTGIAERLSPQELTDWLDTYLEAMTTVVMRSGGVVDDYAGDGIKANFGVPLPRTSEEELDQDARNAVSCALAMQRATVALNAEWAKCGLPLAGIRIGICTGEVVAGTVGSRDRVKYTTLGDTVNIASRLESLDKGAARGEACRILVSESCLERVGGRYEAEPVGRLSLPGKATDVLAYRILREKDAGGKTRS